MDPTKLIESLVTSALDGAIRAAVAAGMPEEEARARVTATAIRHVATVRGTLSTSDAEAAIARAEADAKIAAAAP